MWRKFERLPAEHNQRRRHAAVGADELTVDPRAALHKFVAAMYIYVPRAWRGNCVVKLGNKSIWLRQAITAQRP